MEYRYEPVDQELNAKVELDKTFPLLLSRDNLKEYENGLVNWHKQTTIEISFVIEGAVEVYVFSEKITVKEGNGFFIMPGKLHSVTPSADAKSAIYFTFIFDPEILYGKKGSYFECEYYAPFVQAGVPFYTFSSEEEWAKEVFETAKGMEKIYHDPTAELKLRMQRTLQDIWIAFYHHLLEQQSHRNVQKNTKKILDMISYIHTHYAEKFTLEDMAEQLNISKSECCRYFKKNMHITISDYLLDYRLTKAVQLLEHSSLNITEIAQATGFGDASYFIRRFQEKLNCSPMKYRKQLSV